MTLMNHNNDQNGKITLRVAHKPWQSSNSLIVFNILSTREQLFYYWKPGQLPRTSKVRILGGEPTTTASLNQHHPFRHAKYLYLYPQARRVLTPYQGNVSLKQREAITENHNRTKCRAPSQWIHLENTLVPRAQETVQKRGQKDVKKQRIEEFAVRLCLVRSSTQQVSST